MVRSLLTGGRFPIIGGDVTRLTNLQTLGLFASISPDNQHIASFSQDIIFVMNPDGSGLTMLIPNCKVFPVRSVGYPNINIPGGFLIHW